LFLPAAGFPVNFDVRGALDGVDIGGATGSFDDSGMGTVLGSEAVAILVGIGVTGVGVGTGPAWVGCSLIDVQVVNESNGPTNRALMIERETNEMNMIPIIINQRSDKKKKHQIHNHNK
jgi:hypothetical protein